MHKKREFYILSLLTWVLIIGLWFIATNFGLVGTTLLPSPQRVISAFFDLIENGYNSTAFYVHFKTSMGRLGIALFFAILVAVPLGSLSGYFGKFRAITDSLVNFYRPLPPMAYYVLLIMWLGIDEESKVMLLYLAIFAPIYVASSSAVSRVKEEFILSAKTLGANPSQVFCRIIIPASLPDIFTGIRTAVGVGYTTLVSAEMIASTSGIGWMVMDAYNYLKTDIVFVGIIIMGTTGIVIDSLLRRLGDKIIHWAGK